MDEQIFDDDMLVSVVRQAVIENFEEELEAIIAEDAASKPIVFSERHKQRMAEMFAPEKYEQQMSEITASEHKRKPTSRIIPLSIRILAAAAMICVLLSAALMTAPKVRAAVYGTFVNWFDGFTKFGSDRPATDKLDFEPTLIPEGFAESSRVSDSNSLSLVYTDANGEHLIFYCSPADNSVSVNNDNVVYGQILEGAIIYHTFESTTSDTYSTIVWEMDGHRFYVVAQLPISQLLEIARSVR